MSTPKQTVDTLIHARWVIPMTRSAEVLENTSVAVRDGEIVAVLPRAVAEKQFEAGEVIERAHHALIPGLVNAHTHAAMTLFRGLADDLPLMDWLQNHIWPAEGKWVDEAFMRAGTALAVAEMLRGGTTCFNDMYFFPDVVAEVASRAGMRASVGMIVIDAPTVWAQSADEYLSKGLAVHDQLRNESLVSTTFAPHAPYTVADAALEKIAMYAEELDVPVHMHVHETAFEVESSLAQHGVRPLERLDRLGLLSPRLQAVHMTQLLPGEIETVAARGMSVVHCPESNMKLASGQAPVSALFAAGVNLAIGTDGAASNNDLDMLGETRSAALLAKTAVEDASAFPAYAALQAATLGGAKALGLGDQIGSIEAAKKADLVAVDLQHVSTLPVYQPVAQLVYAASREQVSDVWVAGARLLNQGAFTRLDVAELMAEAASWGEKIAAG